MRGRIGQVLPLIDVLHDEILLGMFDFCVIRDIYQDTKKSVESWQSLVHVCRRWRYLVFGSPCRLSLQLFVTTKTPARDIDIWPALPLIIKGDMLLSSGTDDLIAALRQSNRVCRVSLWDIAARQLEEVLTAMQDPFPELTELRLFAKYGETLPVIPDSFLGGTAKRLRFFRLDGIPFPGLTSLLLYATQLAYLYLYDIPHSGYTSPEAIVTLISVMSNLETLVLDFRSPLSRPCWENRSLPPLKRTILPSLRKFCFKGVTEYTEELMTSIDAPRMHEVHITFFNQVDFDNPGLAQSVQNTPALVPLDEAHVQFDDRTASIKLQYGAFKYGVDDLRINILCSEPDWQLSAIEQVCNSSLPPLLNVKNLYIERRYLQLIWKNDAIENSLWLQLLLPFTAVKKLYVSREFAPGVAAALEEVVGRRTKEVLPSLQNIFVQGLEPSGPVQDSIGQFVAAARQFSSHPITISAWE